MFPWPTEDASELIAGVRDTSLAKLVRDDMLAQILSGDARRRAAHQRARCRGPPARLARAGARGAARARKHWAGGGAQERRRLRACARAEGSGRPVRAAQRARRRTPAAAPRACRRRRVGGW